MSVVDSTVAHRFRTVAPTTFKPYPDTIYLRYPRSQNWQNFTTKACLTALQRYAQPFSLEVVAG